MDDITYAKKNNRKLNVVINDGDGERCFHYTADQLNQSVKRYCAWYNTSVSRETNGEYDTTISLQNGIEFKITLL